MLLLGTFGSKINAGQVSQCRAGSCAELINKMRGAGLVRAGGGEEDPGGAGGQRPRAPEEEGPRGCGRGKHWGPKRGLYFSHMTPHLDI